MPDDANAKFQNPSLTATGEERAWVSLRRLDTLWFNTGTLCNLACANCYIESTPTNDRLVYLTLADVAAYLDEIARDAWPVQEIGITGGEPFMNPDIIPILERCLSDGFDVLVLTNAMKPMHHKREALLGLKTRFGDKLKMRVSIDHFARETHEQERGAGSWAPMLEGLKWLSDHGFDLSAAGRTRWGETDDCLRTGYADLFARENIRIDASDPARLILFPEMDETAPVPEITTRCWSILGVNPDNMMCASSRMVVKRKGADHPVVLACTLLAYDEAFEMGATLAEAARDVRLNHPHCAKFCVLGGASCSG